MKKQGVDDLILSHSRSQVNYVYTGNTFRLSVMQHLLASLWQG